jgi:hypothetical protein
LDGTKLTALFALIHISLLITITTSFSKLYCD